MADYRLLVTEITNYGDLRCVAGWDLDRSKMIRPEPHPKGFWQSGQTGPNGPFKLGATVHFSAKKPSPNTDYPHLTEDRVVIGDVSAGTRLGSGAARELLRDAAFNSLEDLFDGNLVIDGDKAYVPVGAQCASLGGLIVPAKGAVVESYRNYKGQQRLRLRFRDPQQLLAPNLTSSKAYEMHAAGEIDQLNARISKGRELMLRIGLARGFQGVPDRCYMQVNGLKILP